MYDNGVDGRVDEKYDVDVGVDDDGDGFDDDGDGVVDVAVDHDKFVDAGVDEDDDFDASNFTGPRCQ